MQHCYLDFRGQRSKLQLTSFSFSKIDLTVKQLPIDRHKPVANGKFYITLNIPLHILLYIHRTSKASASNHVRRIILLKLLFINSFILVKCRQPELIIYMQRHFTSNNFPYFMLIS